MNTRPDALDASTHKPPKPGDRRGAAFFGLDKTLISGSSLYLLAQGLHERDFYGTTAILSFAWQQLMFRRGLQGAPHVESRKETALEFVQGRSRPDVRALAREIADERILPRVYPDMAALIEHHRSGGNLTFVATAAPSELAEIVAESLGMTGALGTSAEVDEAERYSGRLGGSVLHGPAKASAVEAHAAASGIDLSTSVAYSDSINDLPLLELVGRAEVVNPDRKLRKVAAARQWPVHELRAAKPRADRPARACVSHRLAELGLESHVRPAGYAAVRTGTHHFTVDDPDAFVRELEESGRFRRDSRMGALFHRGKVSLREVSSTDSLHITLGEGNEVSAHIDRYSPLADAQGEEGVRYSLSRIAAHNVTGMAGDIAGLLPGRRRPGACVPADPTVPPEHGEAGAATPWPGTPEAEDRGLSSLPDDCTG